MPHLTLFLLSAEASNRLKRVFSASLTQICDGTSGGGEGQSKCTVGGIACDNAGSWGGKRSFSKFVTFIQYIGGLGHDAAASGRRSEASPRARHRLSGLSAPPPSPLRRGKKARSQEGSCVCEENFHPNITHFIAAAVSLTLPDTGCCTHLAER